MTPSITLTLRLPAVSLDDCVHLLAHDPDLLDVARRYRSWLMPYANEKNLVGRVEALLAQQAICAALGETSPVPADEIDGPRLPMLVIKIYLVGRCDRQLCAIFFRYQGFKPFDIFPPDSREMRLVRKNPSLVACFDACPHDHAAAP